MDDARIFKDESAAEVRAARASGLVPNPCSECEGEGRCECGSSTNAPDAATWIDECPKCEGTGNGVCPRCDEQHAYLVAGDGRCEACVGEDAVELVESEEAVEAHQVAA